MKQGGGDSDGAPLAYTIAVSDERPDYLILPYYLNKLL